LHQYKTPGICIFILITRRAGGLSCLTRCMFMAFAFVSLIRILDHMICYCSKRSEVGSFGQQIRLTHSLHQPLEIGIYVFWSFDKLRTHLDTKSAKSSCSFNATLWTLYDLFIFALAVSFRISLHRLMLASHYTYGTNTGLGRFRGCYTHPHRTCNAILSLPIHVSNRARRSFAVLDATYYGILSG
jgi:hypothetical protein